MRTVYIAVLYSCHGLFCICMLYLFLFTERCNVTNSGVGTVTVSRIHCIHMVKGDAGIPSAPRGGYYFVDDVLFVYICVQVYYVSGKVCCICITYV